MLHYTNNSVIELWTANLWCKMCFLVKPTLKMDWFKSSFLESSFHLPAHSRSCSVSRNLLLCALAKLKQRQHLRGPGGTKIETISAGTLNVTSRALSSFKTKARLLQQSNTDTESVFHLTLVWEHFTLAHTRHFYLIYKLLALSLSQTSTAGACSFNLQWLEKFDYCWSLKKLARSKVYIDAYKYSSF